VAAGVLALACATGCGSAPSAKQQAEHVAVDFANAYRAHDGKRVCALLETAQGPADSKACPELVFTALRGFRAPQSPVVTHLAVTGSHALVSLSGLGPSAQMNLVKTSDGWRVEGLTR
jgi:hypothetical protein